MRNHPAHETFGLFHAWCVALRIIPVFNPSVNLYPIVVGDGRGNEAAHTDEDAKEAEDEGSGLGAEATTRFDPAHRCRQSSNPELLKYTLSCQLLTIKTR